MYLREEGEKQYSGLCLWHYTAVSRQVSNLTAGRGQCPWLERTMSANESRSSKEPTNSPVPVRRSKAFATSKQLQCYEEVWMVHWSGGLACILRWTDTTRDRLRYYSLDDF